MFHRILLAVCLLSLFTACSPQKKKQQLKGQTMGTYYSIVYYAAGHSINSEEVDSILQVINASFSTYDTSSLISRFNQQQSTRSFEVDRHFIQVSRAAKIIHQQSEGAFDPSVYPLVSYYGFARKRGVQQIDSTRVDSIQSLMDYTQLQIQEAQSRIRKTQAKLKIDYSAIAKGYAVDVLAAYLTKRGFDSFMIDIGGETRAQGLKPNQQAWIMGIQDPNSEQMGSVFAKLDLHNKALATSGNYRNFRTINGQKVVHTLNPKTGYNEQNDLLSVSVLHNECMMADGYATAMMVMGFETAKALAEANSNIEVYLIYLDQGEIKHYASEGMRTVLKD